MAVSPLGFLPPGGFVMVPDILSLPQGRQYSEEDVRRVVGNCPKQRFALREHAQTGQLQIRANQGHSIQVWVMLPSNHNFETLQI